MSQSAHPHRKLKITVVVALALVVTLLGFADNFLFDFALNPQAPYTMKMMQDGKDDKKGEQCRATQTRDGFHVVYPRRRPRQECAS